MLSEIVKRFVPCTRPRRVFSSSLGEHIVVPCGTCPQCLNTKSFIAKKACETEQKCHRYAFFVTVTYSENDLPLVTYRRSGSDISGRPLYDLYDTCKRSPTYKQLILSGLSEKDLLFTLKTRYNHYKRKQSPIAYALPRDLQLYIKRLRKSISFVSGEKIRYFAVSDYGGQYARPHFHIIFYLDDPKTFQVFRELSIQKWQFGNVDSSPAANGSASYVSSYITGISSTLHILKHPFFRVRSFHSNQFGSQALRIYKDSIYETSSTCFRGECYALPFGLAEFYGTTTIERTFYPTSYRFNLLSPERLYRVYTLYFDLSRCGEKYSYREFLDRLRDYMLNDWLRSEICTILDLDPAIIMSYDDLPSEIDSRLHTVFGLGRRFYRDICDFDPNKFRLRFKQILDYYKSKMLYKLSQFYKAQEDDNGQVLSLDDYDSLYPHTFCGDENQWSNYVENLKLTHSYECAVCESSSVMDSRIKHKKHSDIIHKNLNYHV